MSLSYWRSSILPQPGLNKDWLYVLAAVLEVTRDYNLMHFFPSSAFLELSVSIRCACSIAPSLAPEIIDEGRTRRRPLSTWSKSNRLAGGVRNRVFPGYEPCKNCLPL